MRLRAGDPAGPRRGTYDHTDGIVDERDVFSYDADGHSPRPTTTTSTGSPSSPSWSWDAVGRELTEAWDYEMTDGWVTPYDDYGWAYTYDLDGNVLVVAYYSGLDEG